MKNLKVTFYLAAVIFMSWGPAMAAEGPREAFSELSLKQAHIRDGFWGPRQELLRTVTLPAQREQLEENHHLNNFRVAAGKKEGAHMGFVFLDSDLYKWLEAASYTLGKHPGDRELRAMVDEVTGLIREAQMDDGYLNTYYQSIAPDRRWTNLLMNHELYCAGHLMEAAVASYEETGSRDLLDVSTRFADYIGSVFGPDKNPGIPGHQEIEPALVRLYKATGEEKYLDLAAHFVYQRGRTKGFRRELIGDLRDQSKLAKIASEKRAPYITKGKPDGNLMELFTRSGQLLHRQILPGPRPDHRTIHRGGPLGAGQLLFRRRHGHLS
jgi:DUF1680 family protein